MFGALEILLCLGPLMLFMFAVGVGLLVQNRDLDKHEEWRGLIPCPHCRKALNPEAYICRFCERELYELSPNN